MDNIGHVQQCLNLGAHSYVAKERLYQVPSRLKRAIEDIQAVGNGGAMMRRERFGQHANFRALYSLRPDRTARLRHPDLKQRVVGGWIWEGGLLADKGGSAQRGDRRGIPVWDEQDRDWIPTITQGGFALPLRNVDQPRHDRGAGVQYLRASVPELDRRRPRARACSGAGRGGPRQDLQDRPARRSGA